MANESTTIDDNIFAGDKPTYDKMAKKFLSKRKLLARILHHLIPEFQKVSLKDIEEKYIQGDPKVGETPVDPGKTNQHLPSEIRGAATEQSEPAEGWVTFDILFYAKLPNNGEIVPFIINIEAQKARPTDYPLLKRVMYYASRLVSSQKEREFTGMDFGKIQKVYTIWLCFEPPAGHVKGGINGYSTVETCIDGDIKEPIEDYTLLNAFVVYVGEQQTGDKLINLLRLIFKEDLNATEKKNRLRDEYNLQLTEEMGEELSNMCNLGEGIEERGIAKGKVVGKAEGVTEATIKFVRNLLEDKDMPYEKIAKKAETTVEEVSRIAEEYGLSYTL